MKKSELKIPWPEGVKKTKQRECVLEILENAQKPMTAMEICHSATEKGVKVWISTIYRILELFVQKATVLKTGELDNGMAVYEINRQQHKHYAVCVGCQKLIAIENCPMDEFVPEVKDGDFHLLGHNLKLYGYCDRCFEKKDN